MEVRFHAAETIHATVKTSGGRTYIPLPKNWKGRRVTIVHEEHLRNHHPLEIKDDP